MADAIRVLYVDDEPYLLDIGKFFLEKSGEFLVTVVDSAPAAINLLNQEKYDAIISDYQMPEMDGIQFLVEVRERFGNIPFILFTGRGREEVVIQAINSGADFYLQKGGVPGAQFAELTHKIRHAVKQMGTEEAFFESQMIAAQIIEFLSDATFVINSRGLVIAWNQAMEKMSGIKPSDIIGKGNYEYSIPFYHERRPILIDLVIKGDPEWFACYPYLKWEGGNLVSEITIPHLNNGRGASLLLTASPLFDSRGTIVGSIESIRDITPNKQVEEALSQANKKLILLSSITRHDINNQLIVQKGYLEILEQKQPDLTLNEYFQMVTTAAQRISAMIRFNKEFEEIGLQAPAWQNCRLLVETATTGITFGQVKVKNCLPYENEVLADPLISRVFYNLMENAVRYGGKITTIFFSIESFNGNQVIVCKDDGVGVPADEKEKIFERGFGKNTGLGLALSREILDISGIHICETGEPGNGARFEIIVPNGKWRKGDEGS